MRLSNHQCLWLGIGVASDEATGGRNPGNQDLVASRIATMASRRSLGLYVTRGSGTRTGRLAKRRVGFHVDRVITDDGSRRDRRGSGCVNYRAEFLAAINQHLPSATNVWPAIVVAAIVALLGVVFRRKIACKLASLSNRFHALRGLSISVPGTATALLFFVLMGVMNGGVTVLLLWSLPVETVPPSVLIAATSWAWIVGFLAVFSPGGLFVREGIFALCLVAWLPYGTGITLAILARLLQMFAEFLGVVCVSFDWQFIIAKRSKLI